MRLMVLGYARHGKDTVCDLLHKHYGLTFESSSAFVAERAVRPWLAARGITYPTYDAMYADRVNHRSDWFDAICDFNKGDPARLGRELFSKFDIYCGLRNIDEFNALKAERAFDFCMWVDASKRIPAEPTSSITMTRDVADHVIDNNGTLEQLTLEVAHAYWLAYTRKRQAA